MKTMTLTNWYLLRERHPGISAADGIALGDSMWADDETKHLVELSTRADLLGAAAGALPVPYCTRCGRYHWGACEKTPDQKRRQRNAARRAQNQILRDMCGTSARAAREDMGL